MSNKFWAAGSDSDSESTASDSSSSDDDRQVGGRTTGRFQMSDSSSGMYKIIDYGVKAEKCFCGH